MRGPLAGLHVVELANEMSGPYATELSVDLGAEVTKIESPAGDRLRDERVIGERVLNRLNCVVLLPCWVRFTGFRLWFGRTR